MSYFFQDDLDVYCLAHYNVDYCQFYLSGRRHDMLDYVRNIKDGSIVGQDLVLLERKKCRPARLFVLGFLR